MSLLVDALESCVMLNKRAVDGGYGGHHDSWEPGTAFSAAIVFDSSMQGREAEAQGVSSLYTVTTSRAFTLKFHDVFQRVRDGKTFRVTSDGDDKYTPKSTALDMRQVTAEEWELPHG